MMLGALAHPLALGWKGENEFLDQLTVFVLSCFVGYMVVGTRRPSTYALMSVTNAKAALFWSVACSSLREPNPGRHQGYSRRNGDLWPPSTLLAGFS